MRHNSYDAMRWCRKAADMGASDAGRRFYELKLREPRCLTGRESTVIIDYLSPRQ